MEEKDLFFINNQEYWNLIDNNFCETNQLINHSKEDCLESIEKGFIHKGENDSRDKILPLTEEYSDDLITFNYPKNWHIFKQKGDEKTIRISKIVDGNGKLYAMISVSKCVPSLETIGEQLLRKEEKGELDVNFCPEGVEKVKIGNYDFYKYVQTDKKYGSEETNYESKVNDVYLIKIDAFHTGYEDYTDDIKRMIETIKLPVNSEAELVDYEDDFLPVHLSLAEFSSSILGNHLFRYSHINRADCFLCLLRLLLRLPDRLNI